MDCCYHAAGPSRFCALSLDLSKSSIFNIPAAWKQHCILWLFFFFFKGQAHKSVEIERRYHAAIELLFFVFSSTFLWPFFYFSLTFLWLFLGFSLAFSWLFLCFSLAFSWLFLCCSVAFPWLFFDFSLTYLWLFFDFLLAFLWSFFGPSSLDVPPTCWRFCIFSLGLDLGQNISRNRDNNEVPFASGRCSFLTWKQISCRMMVEVILYFVCVTYQIQKEKME